MRRGVSLLVAVMGLIAADLFIACGCTPRPTGPPESAPILLTKDDVLTVDQRRLSLSGYLALRQQLRGASKNEVLWTAAAIFALQQEWQSQGKNLDPQAALKLVSQARGEGKRHLEELLSHMVVQRNEHVLDSLIDDSLESYKK